MNSAPLSSKSEYRHCAFCLKELAPDVVLKCGKCLRRVYCGKTCQKKDWTSKFPEDIDKCRGQGHKNWCGLPYGEEDLDWKIVPIDGKGLGIIALRPFAANSRIMVDACQLTPTAHPATASLMPLDGTLESKFELNELCVPNDDDVDEVLCLRMSRVNHKCDANAGHIYSKDYKVKILFAEREIATGEEIMISYTPWWNSQAFPKRLGPAAVAHLRLTQKFGIVCPDDCVCRDETILAAVDKTRQLDSKIWDLSSTGYARQALRAVSELLALQQTIPSCLLNKKRTLYDGFQIGITNESTMRKAREYVREVRDIWTKVNHPEDAEVLKFKNYGKNPQHHRNYLLKSRQDHLGRRTH